MIKIVTYHLIFKNTCSIIVRRRRGSNMKNAILKALKTHQIVEMIYRAKDGNVTSHRIKILNVSDDSFQAFCFTRHAKRTFLIHNVLAIAPPRRFERWVI